MLRAPRYVAIFASVKTAVASLICIVLAGCASSASQTTPARTPAAGAIAAPAQKACSGDVVGTWVITSSQVRIEGLKSSYCAAATMSAGDLELTGNVTYTADGRFTESLSFTGKITMAVPASCLAAGTTCADLPRVLVGPREGAWTCDVSSDGCTCAHPVVKPNETSQGTYALPSPGVLTETNDGSSRESAPTDYCVEGTKMTQKPHPGTRPGMSGWIVLQKQ
jgi:hypothetical protein